MPRPLFVRLAGTGVTIDGRVFEAASAQARALGALLDTLAAQAERLTDPVATVLAQATVYVLVGCLAQQPLRRSGGSSSATVTKLPTLAKLQRFIERHAATRDFGTERSLRNALRDLYDLSPREIIQNGNAVAPMPEPPDSIIERLFDEF